MSMIMGTHLVQSSLGSLRQAETTLYYAASLYL